MACINKELKDFVDECFNRWLSIDSLDKENLKLSFGSLSAILNTEGKYQKVLEKIKKEKEISKKDFSLSLGGGYLYIHRYKKVKKEEKPKKDLKGLNYEYFYKFYKLNYTKSTWTDYQ